MITGSCLCGQVTFQVAEIFYGRYCHCETCRKFSGTTPAAWAAAETARFKLTSASDHVARYNTEAGQRCFCKHCGSPVWYESDEYPEILGIPYGALDDADLPAPELHVWTKSSPSWCKLNNDLPRHATQP